MKKSTRLYLILIIVLAVFCVGLILCLKSCDSGKDVSEGPVVVATPEEIVSTIALALLGADSETSSDAELKISESGDIKLNGERCALYTVKQGKNELFIAVSENNRSYYQNEKGDFISVALKNDNGLMIDSLPLDINTARGVADATIRQFKKGDIYVVYKMGQETVDNITCDLFVAKDAAGNRLATAAFGLDNSWYYKDEKDGIYRRVVRGDGKTWLSEPVNEHEKSAVLVAQELVGKEADSAKADGTVNIGAATDCTVYNVTKGKNSVARVAVSKYNAWYYDSDGKGTYKEISWTESGATAQGVSVKE